MVHHKSVGSYFHTCISRKPMEFYVLLYWGIRKTALGFRAAGFHGNRKVPLTYNWGNCCQTDYTPFFQEYHPSVKQFGFRLGLTFCHADLGPNCLLRLSADATSREAVKKGMSRVMRKPTF